MVQVAPLKMVGPFWSRFWPITSSDSYWTKFQVVCKLRLILDLKIPLINP